MKQAISHANILFTLATLFLSVSSASAETVVINYTDRGWYTPIGYHNPPNLNYIVGDNRGPQGRCGTCADDIRNFFVFNLASVPKPIASATLELEVPVFSGFPGFSSTDSNETYELHDVVTPIASLLGGTAGVGAHADLGSGVVYGSRSMSAADVGTIVSISLNSSAIEALNAASGLFAIGGSLTTLDGLVNDEYAFGWTIDVNVSQLRLTTVPEPGSTLLFGLAAVMLALTRSRFRSV